MADDRKLFEEVEFSPRKRHLRDWGDKVFRYCTFEDIDHDGASFDGAMIHCILRRVTLYWGFFNTATLQSVAFEDCIFPGTSFRGCTFTDCTFTRCRFILDNLGGSCTIDGCVLTGCVFSNCTFEHRKTTADEGEPKRDGKPRRKLPKYLTESQRPPQTIFESNRIHDCRQVGCRGLFGVDGL